MLGELTKGIGIVYDDVMGQFNNAADGINVDATISNPDLLPRAEIAGMALQDSYSIPNVAQYSATATNATLGILNPPAHSDMQVRYTNEMTLENDKFSPAAPI